MKIRLFCLLSLFLLLFLITNTHAEGSKYAIGLNYPGLSFRYALNDKISIEGKVQSETNISVIGVRGYRYLRKARISPFWGLELDTVSYKGEVSEGTGIVLEGFAGGEYFINNSLSFQLDFGPAIIMLTDKNYSVTDTGVELVFNLGVNWYLGKKP